MNVMLPHGVDMEGDLNLASDQSVFEVISSGTSLCTCFNLYFFVCKDCIFYFEEPLQPGGKTSLVKYEFTGGKESTQIFAEYLSVPFSPVNGYPRVFKCEIYCRGILNFNCDAFNRTLCALITNCCSVVFTGVSPPFFFFLWAIASRPFYPFRTA